MLHPDRGAGPDRRGVALAAAVFALAVLGGLVAGNFVSGLLEQQSGRNTLYVMQAAEAAEAALREALVQVPAGALSGLSPGGVAGSLAQVSSAGVTVQREVTRLTGELFLISARASRLDADGTPVATRALGLLVKLTADSAGSAIRMVPLTQRPWVQLY